MTEGVLANIAFVLVVIIVGIFAIRFSWRLLLGAWRQLVGTTASAIYDARKADTESQAKGRVDPRL